MKHVILDTDIFGDPDDIFALVYAMAKKELSIDLIVTADEHGVARAQQTMDFIGVAGESIPVVAGTDLANTKYVFTHAGGDRLVETTFIDHIHQVVSRNELTEYVCIAPQSNLAAYLSRYPEASKKIHVTAMGSSSKLFFDRVEHNVRLDVPAVKKVIEHCNVSWVMADHTVHQKLSFNRKHSLYARLKAIDNPAAKIVCRNIDDFFDALGYEYSYYHDPLTVSTLISSYVSFRQAHVIFERTGRMIETSDGRPTRLSNDVRYSEFAEDFSTTIVDYLHGR